MRRPPRRRSPLAGQPDGRAAPSNGRNVAAEDEDVLLALHRIVHAPVDQFRVDGFVYTSFADALAQARRSRAAPALPAARVDAAAAAATGRGWRTWLGW